MNVILKRFVIFVSTMLLAASCGPEPQQEDYEDESKSSTFSGSHSGQNINREKIAIPIGVQYGIFQLAGTPATNWSITLDDDPSGDPGGASTCLSGYTATVTPATNAVTDEIEVYKDDAGCKAKLVSFEHDGVTYTPSTDFTTWDVDDTAVFSSGGNDLKVTVISQLSDPTDPGDAVVYNFSEIVKGVSETFSESDVSDGHSITVESQEAPQFHVVAATYIGIDDVTGAPEFQFKLECTDDPSAPTTPQDMTDDGSNGDNTLCSQVSLAEIDYKLVKETGFATADTLTVDEADGIFSTDGTSVTIGTDDYQEVGPLSEGFTTVTLDGPGGLGDTSNAHMFLVLRAGVSYTYFNVDVTVIDQTN